MGHTGNLHRNLTFTSHDLQSAKVDSSSPHPTTRPYLLTINCTVCGSLTRSFCTDDHEHVNGVLWSECYHQTQSPSYCNPSDNILHFYCILHLKRKTNMHSVKLVHQTPLGTIIIRSFKLTGCVASITLTLPALASLLKINFALMLLLRTFPVKHSYRSTCTNINILLCCLHPGQMGSGPVDVHATFAKMKITFQRKISVKLK